MERDVEAIKSDLLSMNVSMFLTKWIFDKTPFIFEGEKDTYLSWRHEIAQSMKIDPSDIVLTGSAALGFSLSPHKFFKKFDENSDVDVGIISHHFFDVAWYDLLNIDIFALKPKFQTAVKDHRTRLIYWQTIATDKILPVLSFGQQWNEIIKASRKYSLLENREINFRIYRNMTALRSYLSDGATKCRNELLGE